MLDTNTLVSGFGWEGGPPAQAVEQALQGRYTLVTSPPLLDELDRVLRYSKLARVFEEPRRTVDLVESISVVVSPSRQLAVAQDEPDNRLLEAAQAVSADCLVTGDRGLLELSRFDETDIVSARRFVAHVEGGR